MGFMKKIMVDIIVCFIEDVVDGVLWWLLNLESSIELLMFFLFDVKYDLYFFCI